MSASQSDQHVMEIGFPGGLAVAARFRGHEILTDQPRRAGGADAWPPPFDLFLASIGTCAGFYALRFCQLRGIDTEGLAARLEPLRDPETHRVARIRIELELPPEFPQKYRSAILRAIHQCAVKQHILEPPEFDIALREPVPVPA
jgi:ribosomal protein S12 methylthiotransferase accessory factor